MRFKRAENKSVEITYFHEVINGVSGIFEVRMQADLDTISELTNIDMTGNISVLWMTWDDQYWYLILSIFPC